MKCALDWGDVTSEEYPVFLIHRGESIPKALPILLYIFRKMVNSCIKSVFVTIKGNGLVRTSKAFRLTVFVWNVDGCMCQYGVKLRKEADGESVVSIGSPFKLRPTVPWKKKKLQSFKFKL